MPQERKERSFFERLRDLYNGESAIFGVKSHQDVEKSGHEYYENEFFEQSSTDILEGDTLQIGAPGQYTFAELCLKMKDVTTDGYVKKRIVHKGLGQPINEGSLVEMHYNAYWEGENLAFDSTYLRSESKKFIIGDNEVLPGLEEAVKTMVVGEEARFIISYKLLFGERGCPPRVKPKADALFYIEITRVIEHYDITKYDHNSSQLPSFEIAFKCAKSLHNNAVDLFKKNNLKTATKFFQQAVTVLQAQANVLEEDIDLKTKLLVTLYTNLAVCYNKESKPKKASSMCKEIAKLTNINENSKALYHYGVASQNLGDYEEALELMRKAYLLKPRDLDIKVRLDQLKIIHEEQMKKEKEMCAKIFGLEVKQAKEKPNVSDIFEHEIKTTLEFFKSSKMKRLELDVQLSPDEVAYLDIAIKNYKFELYKNNTKKYVLEKTY